MRVILHKLRMAFSLCDIYLITLLLLVCVTRSQTAANSSATSLNQANKTTSGPSSLKLQTVQVSTNFTDLGKSAERPKSAASSHARSKKPRRELSSNLDATTDKLDEGDFQYPSYESMTSGTDDSISVDEGDATSAESKSNLLDSEAASQPSADGSASVETHTIARYHLSDATQVNTDRSRAPPGNDIEQLVRFQVDRAADHWATPEPGEQQVGDGANAGFNRNLNSFNQLSNFRIGQFASEEWQKRVEAIVSEAKMHPNHNYKPEEMDASVDQSWHQFVNSPTTTTTVAPSGPQVTVIDAQFLPTNPDPVMSSPSILNKHLTSIMQRPPQWGPRASAIENSGDLFTTSSRVEPTSSRTRYYYRPRGPITSSTKPFNPPTPPSVRLKFTQAPDIMKTFQRLDRMRSKQDQLASDSNHIGGSVRDLPIRSLASLTHYAIPKGFIDHPASAILLRGQQVDGNTVQSQSQAAPSKSQWLHGSHRQLDSRGTTTTNFDHEKQQTRTSQSALDRDQLSKVQTTIRPSQQHNRIEQATSLNPMHTASINGSLAARLYVNRHRTTPSLMQVSASTPKYPLSPLGSTAREPLVLDFHRSPSHAPVYSFTTSPTVESSPMASSATLGPVASSMSTQQMPSLSRLTTSLAGGATSSLPPSNFVTRSPNLAPALYAASLARSRSNSSLLAMQAVGRPARHHHLHSHVHSIKPALISIPIPIQPKLTAYDSLVAAAAAAAAAATSRMNQQQQQLEMYQGGQVGIATKETPSIRVGGTRVMPSLLIPIGGTIASARLTHPLARTHLANLQQARGQLPKVSPNPQSHSKLANLLDSANRAIKTVAGSTAGLLSPSSGKYAPTTASDLLSKKQATNSASLYPSKQSAESLAAASSSHELESLTSSPIESIGLYQMPSATDQAAELDGFLETIIRPSGEEKREESYSSSNGSYSEHQSISSPLDVDWSEVFNSDGRTNSEGSSVLNNSSSTGQQLDPETILLGMLEAQELPGLLFPQILSTPLNRPQAAITGSSNVFETFSQPIHNSIEDQSNLVSSFDSPQWPNERPLEATNAPGRQRQVGESLGFRSVSAGSARDKDKLARPMGSRGKLIHHLGQAAGRAPMRYALAHYVDDQGVKAQQVGEEQLFQEFYDWNGTKYSVPQMDNFRLIDLGDTGFRPIKPQHYKQSGSSPGEQHQLNSLSLMNGKHSPANTIDGGSDRTRKAPVVGRPVAERHPESSRAVQLQQIQTHPAQLNYPRPQQPIVPLSKETVGLIRPSGLHQVYQVYPGELIQHALMHASSSVRPHLLAASSLLNYHRDHLLDHHMLHHQLANSGQDMATSESVRTSAGLPAKGASMLMHLWPMALALLPIMIVVAIVSQLVMTAPLVMFALAVSRASNGMSSQLGLREDSKIVDRMDSRPPSSGIIDSIVKQTKRLDRRSLFPRDTRWSQRRLQ